MQCPNGCDTPMKQVRVDRLVCDRNDHPLVMVNLLMNLCPECGQESMPLESARIVEEALEGERTPTGQFTAPMYEVA